MIKGQKLNHVCTHAHFHLFNRIDPSLKSERTGKKKWIKLKTWCKKCYPITTSLHAKKMLLMQDKCACRCQVQLQMFCVIWWQACMFNVKAKSSSSYATREIVLVVPLCFVATKWVVLTKMPPFRPSQCISKWVRGFHV